MEEEQEEGWGKRQRRGRGVERPTNCSRLPTLQVQEEQRGDAPERTTGRRERDRRTGGQTARLRGGNVEPRESENLPPSENHTL